MSEKDLEVLNEANISKKTIETCSATIYAHLMKFTAIPNRSSKWLDTIAEQIKILTKKDAISGWRDFNNDPNIDVKYNKIHEDAVETFINDNIKSGHIYYTQNNIPENSFATVFGCINDVNEFRRYFPVKAYLLQVADNCGDREAARMVERHTAFRNVTVKD